MLFRTSSPYLVTSCEHCGIKGVKHTEAGHGQGVRHPESVIRLMRVPLEDRLAKRAAA
jgi:hypothetical protein